MSAKNVDKYNRFRSITVAFRVSPEEQKELNRAIALSGLPKQEYCYRKCMEREVVREFTRLLKLKWNSSLMNCNELMLVRALSRNFLILLTLSLPQ